jgi:HlyD family secretion protein
VPSSAPGRSVWPWLAVIAVVAGFGWTLRFLYVQSQETPVVFETQTPRRADVVLKTVASGAIVPRREVAIKPRVSGVVERLLVEPGQKVNAGDLIAQIKIIPNVVNLNAAEARLASAQINLKSAEFERARLGQLRAENLLPQGEYTQALLAYDLANQEVKAATANLQLVREGAIRGTGKVSNQVQSTVAGTVMEVPVKQGASVIEANTFSEGTTIAAIADMSDLIFEGKLDESEVGKVRVDMPAWVTIGALDGVRLDGKLEHIAPKGTEKDGTIEFQVRVAVTLDPKVFVRSNYSANASIILDQRTQVLVIDESLLQFDKDKQPLVEVMTLPQVFEPRKVQLGLSDGVIVEILGGLEANERVKVPVVGTK